MEEKKLMNNTDARSPIGVFDSGVGGLTVMREIIRNLPGENIEYFGDTARVPYGSKSKETVLRYSRQITHFLLTKEVKAIVVACNTASALALDELVKETEVPVIGVVKPGASAALKSTVNKRIGVIATQSTIKSGLYPALIAKSNPDVKVFGQACPLFVPLVEEGWTKDEITKSVARRYLNDLLEKDIDTLIMGCTHYPLLRSLLKEICGDKVNLVNPAYETALCLKELLDAAGIANDSEEKGCYNFYVSDSGGGFSDFAGRIFPGAEINTREIQIENY